MNTSVGFLVCFGSMLMLSLQDASVCFAQQKSGPAKARPQPAKPLKPAAAPFGPQQPQVLTNESVIRMVSSGMDEASIVAAIAASPAQFQLDADHLVQLNDQKVPGAVLRAMLGKSASPAPEAAATSPEAAPSAAPLPVPANLDHASVRQGGTALALADHPQSVVFVKTDSTSAKEAIANLLLSDVGLSLITMGLAPQMKMWNPYFGDTLTKVTTLGKGLLRSSGANTNGFEYGTLHGTTADVTLREGKPELLIPMNNYLASADVDLAAVQPVLLRLETREKDQSRLLSSRHVVLKETKKGRFDFKPTIDRQELGVEQNVVPADVELTADHVYRITPKQDLQSGEYALVLRKKAESGAFTADLPLKPTPAPQQQPDQMPFGMMMPPAQPQGRAGLLQRSKPAPSPGMPPGQQGPMVGFLAWDFRVLK